jgi:putative membrane protein insertion efficiency factor
MNISLRLISFYQKFLTIFSYGSCRYYPTCSEYAKWQIENNNFILALYKSLIRLLKCNQLFVGGIDYPIIYKDFSKLKPTFKKINIKYWYIPKDNNRYYLIKNRKWDYE